MVIEWAVVREVKSGERGRERNNRIPVKGV